VRYIWQQKDWPTFTWSTKALQDSIYKYALEASALIGQMAHMGEEDKREALMDIMISEAIKTSQIEGENLNREDVRSSIRNLLGLNVPPERINDQRVNGVAQLMLSVQENYAEPLSAELLWQWHDMLISDSSQRERLEIGRWRTSKEPMQIVSGYIGHEKVHYEALPSQVLSTEMGAFIKWFNESTSLQAPIRAAVAHLYFESIHPFSDGNGRVGRAISEMALSQELKHPVLLSLSTTIEARRKEYYDQLSKASRGTCDITEWVIWFTDLVLSAQIQAKEQINFVLAKARFWDTYSDDLSPRQSKVIARMLHQGLGGFEGGMSATKYMKLTECSKATATRDLTDMHNKGCLTKQDGGGRSTRYDVKLI